MSRRKLSQVKKKIQLTVYSNMELSKLTVKWAAIREQLEGNISMKFLFATQFYFPSIGYTFLTIASVMYTYFPSPSKQ